MYLRVGIATMLLVFLAMTVAQSQPVSEDKRKQKLEYERELQRLKRLKPNEYEDHRKLATFTAHLLLGRLGYGVGPFSAVLDEKTEKALREYQKLRNLPVTGDPLSYETFEQIGEDTELLDYRPVTLPSLHVFLDFWNQGYVSAKGTWVLTNEKMGFPEQTSDISCVRDTRTCTEATAIVSGKGSNRRLAVDTDSYTVERWDEYEIVTKLKETAFGCVRYIRRFNRVQKSVTGLRSTISTGGACKEVEAKEMNMTLSDGFQIYRELDKSARKIFGDITRFSPDLSKSAEQQPSK
jgi:hypothetical protein